MVLEKLLSLDAGKTCRKMELANAIWQDRGALKNVEHSISVLRDVFKDKESPHRFIRTIHDHGYVFLKPVIADTRIEKVGSSSNLGSIKTWSAAERQEAFTNSLAYRHHFTTAQFFSNPI